MKIYHTETQEYYDALMIELEEQGCKWFSGLKPTESTQSKDWVPYKEKTCVTVKRGLIAGENIDST